MMRELFARGATLKLLKYREDRIPVTVFFTVTAIDLAIYFLVGNIFVIIAYWLSMIMVKGLISAWNHHHQHVPMFHAKPLNRILELAFALHTGATTNAWVLHHVHGHHKNYLDQKKDESRWLKKEGQAYGYYEYLAVTVLTAYPRAYEVGRNHPRLQRDFVRYGILALAVVTTLVILNPINGLFLFVFPMITSLLMTIAATYHHHSGLDTDDHMRASRNYTGKFRNKLSGNLGYHTAHHYRQGLHWSKLPELHAQIEDQIPDEFIQHSSHKVASPAS